MRREREQIIGENETGHRVGQMAYNIILARLAPREVILMNHDRSKGVPIRTKYVSAYRYKNNLSGCWYGRRAVLGKWIHLVHFKSSDKYRHRIKRDRLLIDVVNCIRSNITVTYLYERNIIMNMKDKYILLVDLRLFILTIKHCALPVRDDASLYYQRRSCKFRKQGAHAVIAMG